MKAILVKNLKQLEHVYKWTTELIANITQKLELLNLPCYLIIANVNHKR